MHCLTCQYDLTNLTEHRCPECGRWFDPNDPDTYDHENSTIRQHAGGPRAIVGFALYVPVAALLMALVNWITSGQTSFQRAIRDPLELVSEMLSCGIPVVFLGNVFTVIAVLVGTWHVREQMYGRVLASIAIAAVIWAVTIYALIALF